VHFLSIFHVDFEQLFIVNLHERFYLKQTIPNLKTPLLETVNSIIRSLGFTSL